MSHARQRLASRGRPQRLGDLFGLHDPVALTQQVLEDVTGTLLEPVAAQRSLAAVDPDATERLDRELGTFYPVRVGPAAAITGITRAPAAQDARPPPPRRRRHPHRAARRGPAASH